MNSAEYILCISEVSTSELSVACTGEQAVQIFRLLKDTMPPCTWFAADIDTNNYVSELNKYKEPFPIEMGDIDKTIELAQKVRQFLSGIFLAVPKNVAVNDWPDRSYFTDDPPERELGEALIEVRAFDTSYFEILANERGYLEKLSSVFGGEIKIL